MRLLYVAGKYRGPSLWEIENNVRRAEEVAFELWLLGAAVICPHTNSRFFHGILPDEDLLDGTRVIMERCDGIVLIPGWEDSIGARAERAMAYSRRLSQFIWPEDRDRIKAWIDAEEKMG